MRSRDCENRQSVDLRLIAATLPLSVAPAATNILFGTVELFAGVQIVTVRLMLPSVHGGTSHLAANDHLPSRLSSGADW